MQLFYQPGIADGIYHLDPEESRHCIKVLRKQTGDLISLTDGKGTFFQVRIINDDIRKCQFEIVKQELVPESGYRIHIGIAPTKNLDRTEWFVEKCTEIGVDEISLFISSNSERRDLKIERLYRKMVSAMKQSVKARLPLINHPLTFKSLVDSVESKTQKFIAHVDPSNQSLLLDLVKKKSNYCVLIGPEGDFTKEELSYATSAEFDIVSLGPSRLRTETAGVVACHTLNLVNN